MGSLIGAGSTAYQADKRQETAEEAMEQQADGIPVRSISREVAPGVAVEQQKEGTRVTQDVEFSPQAEQRLQQRQEAVDELFQSIGTTDQERQQQFQDAKQAFMDQFRATVEEPFEQQRQQLQANQAATGTGLTSVGRSERSQLKEQQSEQFSQAAREAEQLARNLQAQEEQRRLNLIGSLQSDINTKLNRAQQGFGGASAALGQTANQSLQAQQQNVSNQMALANMRSRSLSNIGSGAGLGAQVGTGIAGMLDSSGGQGRGEPSGFPEPRIRTSPTQGNFNLGSIANPDSTA